MKKFRVTVERSAVTVLTYTVEAEDEDAAEAIVEAAIDSNALSSLGAPTEEAHYDDEESQWLVNGADEVED